MQSVPLFHLHLFHPHHPSRRADGRRHRRRHRRPRRRRLRHRGAVSAAAVPSPASPPPCRRPRHASRPHRRPHHRRRRRRRYRLRPRHRQPCSRPRRRPPPPSNGRAAARGTGPPRTAALPTAPPIDDRVNVVGSGAESSLLSSRPRGASTCETVSACDRVDVSLYSIVCVYCIKSGGPPVRWLMILASQAAACRLGALRSERFPYTGRGKIVAEPGCQYL